jgi:heptosyltransferase-1
LGTERKVGELRILIVRIGALGDVLHALPAVAALRERMPGCFLGWAVEPKWGDLLEARTASAATPRGPQRPIVDRIHRVPTRAWKRRPFSPSTLLGILRLRRELRAERYDVCVDLQGAIRSAVTGRMAGAQRFAGPDAPRERPARWLYRQRISVTATHVVDQACEILGAALGEPLQPAPVLLPVEDQAEVWVAKVLASRGLDERDRFVVIAPRAGWGAKQWPAELYNELAIALRAAHLRVLVNAAGEGDSVAKAVARNAADVVPCNVVQLTALLRRASLVIGGDTGPVHLAAALGKPVVALFGPTDPARTGPFGTRSIVLRDPGSVVDHTRHKATEAGLCRIAVDDVLAAALTLLGEPADG